MTTDDIIALLPIIILSGSAVVIMLVIPFYRNSRLTLGLTLAGIALSLASLPFAESVSPRNITPLLIQDHYGLFFVGLILVASAIVSMLFYSYHLGYHELREEFYILLMLATLGAVVLVLSSHFVSFFLGLEILTISLYVMIAYFPGDGRELEAGIKYLILAAISSTFLLFGMALIYADQGTMAFDQMHISLAAGPTPDHFMLFAGLGMLIIGFGFKMALVPFHMWVADVYEGAPAPVTAFVATVSKGAIFALLIRFFFRIQLPTNSSIFLMFAVISIGSMLIGNLLGLLQKNVKRMLAYSSIAHLGYLIVAFLATGEQAVTAAALYLVAYFVTNLGAFGIISILSGPEEDMALREDYRGLFWQRPWLAMVFTLMLLSLIGIPVTLGFIAKFYILLASIGSALWVLSLTLITGSAIGLYYYLRVIVAMFSPVVNEERMEKVRTIPLTGSLALGAMLVLLLWWGIYPRGLIDIIRSAVAGLL
jgi:NADH-quinone oxidoreductase subunit N